MYYYTDQICVNVGNDICDVLGDWMPRTLLSLFLLVFCGFGSTIAAANSSQLLTDPVIEAQLDNVLTRANTPEALSELQTLHHNLNTNTPLLTRVRAWNYLAIEYARLRQFDAAWEELKAVRQLAEQSESADAIAETEASALLLYILQGKTSAALAHINTALLYIDQVQLPRIRYFVHSMVAFLYQHRSQFDQALEHYIHAADAISATQDSRTLLRLLSTKIQIASLYGQQKHHELALEQLDDAERIALEHDLMDTFGANLYLERAYVEVARQNYDVALTLYQKLREQLHDQPHHIGLYLTVLNNMGDVYIRTGSYDEARKVLTEVYELAQLNPEQFNPEVILFNLSYVDIFLGNVEQGLATMQQIVAESEDKLPTVQYESLLGEYADALIHLEHYPEAIAVLLKQRDLREQVYRSEQQKNMAELQNLYDSKDKALQIELLQQKNELNLQLIENEAQKRTILKLMIALASFAVVLVIVLYRSVRRSNQKLKIMNSRLAEQSTRDPLTGLLNRRALQHYLRQPAPQRQDAMLLLDVDHFKRINDTLGHVAGDHVLIEVARRLLHASRDTDLVVRWGGEEFLIYLVNSDPSKLPVMAQRILDTIAATPITVGNQHIHVTATIGFINYPLATVDDQALNWEQTLQLADVVLYAAKVHGRNQAWGVMALNQPFADIQQLLETDLPQAIEQDALTVTVLHGPPQLTHGEKKNSKKG